MSATMMSGRTSRALFSASSPVPAVITLKSSHAKVMLTTFCIVMLSSAISSVRGMPSLSSDRFQADKSHFAGQVKDSGRSETR
jgi:hypothetical protein